MKIGSHNTKVPLNEIKMGECFLKDERLYIKTSACIEACSAYRVVDLNNGACYTFGKWLPVEPVSARIVIEESE